MSGRLRILIKPSFLIALALLVLNDHWLKAAYPSWLTGKLSDFSGLLVFTVFFFVVVGRFIQKRKDVVILHLVVALLFTIWKLAPVEVLTGWLGSATGLPMPSRVKDGTDLIALAVLVPICFWLCRWLEPRRIEEWLLPDRKVAMVIVLLVAGWSIMATSYVHYDYQIAPERGIKSRLESEDVARIVKETMNDNGFIVSKLATADSGFYRFYFSWDISVDTVGKSKGRRLFFLFGPRFSKLNDSLFAGTLTLLKLFSNNTWTVETILSASSDQYNDEMLTEAIKEKLYKELKQKLSEEKQ